MKNLRSVVDVHAIPLLPTQADPGDQHSTSSVTHSTLGYGINLSPVEPHLASRKRKLTTGPRVGNEPAQRTTTDPAPNQAVASIASFSPLPYLLRPYSYGTALPTPYSPLCRSSSVAEPLRQLSIYHAHLPDCPGAGCGRMRSDGDLREISFDHFMGFYG